MSEDLWFWAMIQRHNLTQKTSAFGHCFWNGVYSRNNLIKGIKDVILDEHVDVGTRLIAFYVKSYKVTYFDNSAIKHIQEKLEKFIGNRNL